jgi:hypothetical protein
MSVWFGSTRYFPVGAVFGFIDTSAAAGRAAVAAIAKAGSKKRMIFAFRGFVETYGALG